MDLSYEEFYYTVEMLQQPHETQQFVGLLEQFKEENPEKYVEYLTKMQNSPQSMIATIMLKKAAKK